ncbi:MAG: hypothetical protein SOW08_10595 [Lachnospiraceae bacterium]|nr:hypothetical protein [Lachnospiraceae bacterium]
MKLKAQIKYKDSFDSDINILSFLLSAASFLIATVSVFASIISCAPESINCEVLFKAIVTLTVRICPILFLVIFSVLVANCLTAKKNGNRKRGRRYIEIVLDEMEKDLKG